MLHNWLMDTFQALAEPTRRSIVTMLATGERSAGEIGAKFTITSPAVSQHLKALRQAGLVKVRVDGQRRIYALNREGLNEMDEWLSNIRKFWNNSLDALEAELRKENARKGELKS